MTSPTSIHYSTDIWLLEFNSQNQRGCTNITLKLKTGHKVSCISTSQRRISSGRQTKLQTTYNWPFLQQSVLPGLEPTSPSLEGTKTMARRHCEGIHGPTTRRRRRLGALRGRVLSTRICGRQKSQNAS
jgi:hypothetical protein